MDYFAQRQAERAQDRNELAQIKSELTNVKLKTAMLDDPRAIAAEAKRASRVSPDHLRKWGFDPRNPQHRQAWRQRNDPL